MLFACEGAVILLQLLVVDVETIEVSKEKQPEANLHCQRTPCYPDLSLMKSTKS
jgi:hypothetical protein